MLPGAVAPSASATLWRERVRGAAALGRTRRLVTRVRAPLARWAPRLTFSLIDQGVTSVANFSTNVLLVRWLPATEYGTYALGFSAYLLLLGFTSALFTEPMVVIGPTRYADRLGAYIGHVVRVSVFASLALGAAVVSISVAWPRAHATAPALAALGVALPGLMVFQVLRRACYLVVRPALAAQASVAYAGVLLASIWTLRHTGRLSADTALVATGGAAVVLCAHLALLLWREGHLARPVPRSDTPALWRAHWGYGRWVLGTGLLFWLSDTVYTPLMAVLQGLSAAGAFRAMQNLATVATQVIAAMGPLFLPFATANRAQHGRPAAARFTARVFVLFVGIGVAYATVLGVGGGRLLAALYGPGKVGGALWMLPYFQVSVVAVAITQGAGLALSSIERPELMFWARVAAVAGTVAVWGAFGRHVAPARALALYVGGAALIAAVGAVAAYRLVWKQREAGP